LIVSVKKAGISLCFLLFFAYTVWHLSGYLTKSFSFNNKINISSISITWSGFLNFKTIFLSIIIEAIPFILIGVFVSALLQNFVSEEQIKRFLPGSKYSKILLACLMGIIFPVCECGIVPVARRLVSKGVPLYSAVTFMLAAPIINPVVASSTAVAFSANPKMVCYRLGLAFLVSFAAGLLVSYFFDSGELRGTMPHSNCDCGCSHDHNHSRDTFAGRLVSTLRNACDEFFEMGKYLKNPIQEKIDEIRNSALIKVTEDNFTIVNTETYLFPERYVGKEISMLGFVYKEPGMKPHQFALGRYLITCCSADASFAGFLCEYDNAGDFKEGNWLTIRGTIKVGQYEGSDIPMILISTFNKAEQEPENPYIY